ncbi:metallophosphoesterase [Syntrophomonas wolfei]|uniref:metallophosphoesterase n=1 Tax=Syntrophomonas wolfei TaxID=863 RepID=UPI000B05E3AB|nr:metallophosphoesterase [Syntrophomonas wolfei]
MLGKERDGNMLYVTGDTHGELDIRKLNTTNFPEQYSMTKEDYVAIMGDFGLVWNDGKEDLYWRKWLADRNFTTLFIDGNHENFDLLKRHEVVEWHGGKVQFINDSIIHLMRGQVYEIDGKTIFTMGGGTSIDKEFRKPGKSWWPDELPTYEEYEEALRNLDQHNWKVDYVFTHTISNNIMKFMRYEKEESELNTFFDLIEEELTFRHWYFGHFHADEQVKDNYRLLYIDVIPVQP